MGFLPLLFLKWFHRFQRRLHHTAPIAEDGLIFTLAVNTQGHPLRKGEGSVLDGFGTLSLHLSRLLLPITFSQPCSSLGGNRYYH